MGEIFNNKIINLIEKLKIIDDSIDFIEVDPDQYDLISTFEPEKLSGLAEDKFLRKKIDSSLTSYLTDSNKFIKIFTVQQENTALEFEELIEKYKTLYLDCFSEIHKELQNIKNETYNYFLEKENECYLNEKVELLKNFTGISNKFIDYDINNLINDLESFKKCDINLNNSFWEEDQCSACYFQLGKDYEIRSINDEKIIFKKEDLLSLKSKNSLNEQLENLKENIVSQIDLLLMEKIKLIISKFGVNQEDNHYNECSRSILEYALNKLREESASELIIEEYREFFDISYLNELNIKQFEKIFEITNNTLKQNIIKSLNLISNFKNLQIYLETTENLGNIQEFFNSSNNVFDNQFKQFLKALLESELTDLERIKDNYGLSQVKDVVEIDIDQIDDKNEQLFVKNELLGILNSYFENLILDENEISKLGDIEKELQEKEIKIGLLTLSKNDRLKIISDMRSNHLNQFIKFKKLKYQKNINFLLNQIIQTGYSRIRENIEEDVRTNFILFGYLLNDIGEPIIRFSNNFGIFKIEYL